MSFLKKLVILSAIQLVCIFGYPAAASSDRHPKPANDKSESEIEPIPFRFLIDEISLTSKGNVIVRDSFDRDGRLQPSEINGAPATKGNYYVSFGRIGPSNVKGGALVIDESQTINAYGDFVAMMSLPIDNRGKLTFTATEMFGDLAYSVRLRAPKLRGPERFKIGIGAMESFLGGLASISLQKNSITLQRQGRRAWDEVILDKVDTSKFTSPEWVEITFRADADGNISGAVKIKSEGQVFDFTLRSPNAGDRVAPMQQNNVTANIFIETLPRPRVFALHPQNVTAKTLKDAKGVLPITVYGVGFAGDAQVELFPDDEKAQAAVKASGVRLLYPNSMLGGKVVLPDLEPKSYSVRITSGGETTVRKGVLYVSD
ncbi:MAG TPA: hypothetical protein VFV34_10445 [Blastocatellia bacterium]|nr:hypothetical protein [Blastocatellia bacterium]